MNPAVSPRHAAALLIRLRLRRLSNQLRHNFGKKLTPGAKREGTAKKETTGSTLAVVLGVLSLFGYSVFAFQAVQNIEKELGSSPRVVDELWSHPLDDSKVEDVAKLSTESWVYGKNGEDFVRAQWNDRLQKWVIPVPLKLEPKHARPWSESRGATLELILLWFAILLITLGSKELAVPDWDLEWLVTLPLPLRTLLSIRILERTVVNPAGLATYLPFLTIWGFHCGLRWSAPLLAIVLTFLLLNSLAVVRTLFDTGLRLRLSPSGLRNLQAILNVAGIVMLYVAMSMVFSSRGGSPIVMGWVPYLPEWTKLLPPGLAVEVLTVKDPKVSALALLALALQTTVLFRLGSSVLHRQLRHGVVAGGAREAARGHDAELAQPREKSERWLLTPIQSRELRLLSRDRTFLVQTLVLPIVAIGSQILLRADQEKLTWAYSPTGIATMAFGLASYGLMFSAMQNLNAEGQALWILYTVPRRLESILREKAALWSFLSLIYPAAILGWGFYVTTGTMQELAGLGAMVLIGVPTYAVIATALGVFASDPLATDVQRRLRPVYVNLFMFLALPYGVALYAAEPGTRAVLMALTFVLAGALWQKARDHLPYLLDPTASPPSQVSLADGVIAVFAFFVLQIIASFFGAGSPGARIFTAFVIAGAVVFVVVRIIYSRAQTRGVPALWNSSGVKGLGLGMLAGALAALAGLTYLRWVESIDTSGDLTRIEFPAGSQIWISILAVVAAPLFEEFIFRGLVYGGLRRSLSVIPAVLVSALIFAIVHPTLSLLPVFALGVCAALVYEKTKMLAAPMIAHAIYNLAIVVKQVNF